MSDTTVIDHERRLTRLEIGIQSLVARIEQLEQAEQQRRVDKEQTDRREMAELRARLAQESSG